MLWCQAGYVDQMRWSQQGWLDSMASDCHFTLTTKFHSSKVMTLFVGRIGIANLFYPDLPLGCFTSASSDGFGREACSLWEFLCVSSGPSAVCCCSHFSIHRLFNDWSCHLSGMLPAGEDLRCYRNPTCDQTWDCCVWPHAFNSCYCRLNMGTNSKVIPSPLCLHALVSRTAPSNMQQTVELVT